MKAGKTQRRKYKKKNVPAGGMGNEIIAIFLLAAGVLMLLSFYFVSSIGLFGEFLREAFTGLLGLPAFLVPPLTIVYSILVLVRKNTRSLNWKLLYAAILLVLLSALIQTGVYRTGDYENMTLLKGLQKFFRDGADLIGGGVLGGLVSYPLLLIFQSLGTIIILTTFSIVDIILLTNSSIVGFFNNLRGLFAGAIRRGREALSVEESEDFSGPVPSGGEEGEPAARPRSKIIDFKIEKTSREQKERPEETGKSAPELEYTEPEPVVGEIKRARKTGAAKAETLEKTPVIERSGGVYRFPPIGLLDEAPETGRARTQKNYAVDGARKLEETLSSFGVAAKVINVSRGPTITRYELQPSAGVKVSRIVNLADDISLNLAASGVRIEAPIPGKAAIGIEVPNKEITVVTLKEVVDSEDFRGHKSKLAFALGKDITGNCLVADIARMPHLLIAGATGSGKSVCINSLVISIIYKASPDEVKLLMIDPKVVELGVYNGIPHLLIPVVTDPKKAAGALNWAVQEMINRYKLFADRSVRDIKGYNEAAKALGEPSLPQIVLIIDELADLMMVAPNEVEDSICRLAQMARAAGMHLVIATQRPSVDVITGVIKANIPSRISFAVSSQIDSRTILDMAGAEKLMGRGDMLFYPVGKPKPIRAQGAFITDDEVERVVDFIKAQASSEYDPNIIEEINTEKEPSQDNPGDNDELLPRAIELVLEAGQASVSLIQRKFKVGYARAARIIDQMETRGIIGGYEGSKPRQILITKQQWNELQMTQEK